MGGGGVMRGDDEGIDGIEGTEAADDVDGGGGATLTGLASGTRAGRTMGMSGSAASAGQ